MGVASLENEPKSELCLGKLFDILQSSATKKKKKKRGNHAHKERGR